MLALSTGWKSAEVETGFEILAAVEKAGFSAIELEYRITVSMYEEMRPVLRRQEPAVTSVHNFFPAPDPKNPLAGLDLFHLTSLDKSEREHGIKLTQQTIRIASELEAGAVVVHLGEVDMDPEMERIRAYFRQGELEAGPGSEFWHQKLQEREEKLQKHLDAAFFSLEKIGKEAERRQVLVGLETRYHYHEMPALAELQAIFREFAGSNLRYWHDTGHAQVRENLGLEKHEDYLQSFSDLLAGMHLHDVVGLEDHLAPGSGSIDFDMVGKYCGPQVRRVIEVQSKVSRDDLLQGAAYLLGRGF